PCGGDRARALKGRGRKAARLVGRYLTKLGEAPEFVLSSDALRARETAELAREEGGWSAPLELTPAIYESGTDGLLRQIRAAEAAVTRLLLVGHQPGLSLLIGELTGNEPDFPTAALARIDFELERWSAVAPRSGHLVWLVTPDGIGAQRPKPGR
ncbi:MAG: histidine phosphatase family protein, partial [Planctomycetes bacterium]|nr:histidine phosphatase family protein [Planctomycetota bacterium]